MVSRSGYFILRTARYGGVLAESKQRKQDSLRLLRLATNP